jgi:uncharacterized membrane protein
MADFLQNNWLWILAIVFIGIHLFAGGCGVGHHDRPENETDQETKGGEKRGFHWIFNSGTMKSSPCDEAPLEILKRRYAKGEIDREESVTRKQEL